jgi:hypothetical protein
MLPTMSNALKTSAPFEAFLDVRTGEADNALSSGDFRAFRNNVFSCRLDPFAIIGFLASSDRAQCTATTTAAALPMAGSVRRPHRLDEPQLVVVHAALHSHRHRCGDSRPPLLPSAHTPVPPTPVRPYSRPPYPLPRVMRSPKQGWTRPTSAPGLAVPNAHICFGTGCAHICAGTGTPTSAPGLARPHLLRSWLWPHLRRDWHAHICAGTGTPTSASGLAVPTSPPGLARPHLRREPSRCRRHRRSIGS